METEIYFLLHSLGIGAKYRGFRYLAYGIALCMEDEDYLLRVSKTLYPKIAQTFQVSSSCVERDTAPLFPSAGPAETVICSFRFLCIRF